MREGVWRRRRVRAMGACAADLKNLAKLMHGSTDYAAQSQLAPSCWVSCTAPTVTCPNTAGRRCWG